MKNESALPLKLRLEMLSSILEFMIKSGIDEPTIRESLAISLEKLKGRDPGGIKREDSLRMGNENISAELLRLWHRDARYIDSNAKPRPLALNSGRNNLCATIRRLDSTADATEVLREMKAVNLIRKTSNGKYLPTSESAIVSRLHPLAVNHIAKLVVRLVSTVSRNINTGTKTLPLIERHAYAPDLSWTQRENFAEFTRAQGMVYLEAVDNWLEQRRVRHAVARSRQRDKGVAASVHLFAYLDDGNKTPPAHGSIGSSSVRVKKERSNRTNVKKSTPSRAARA